MSSGNPYNNNNNSSIPLIQPGSKVMIPPIPPTDPTGGYKANSKMFRKDKKTGANLLPKKLTKAQQKKLEKEQQQQLQSGSSETKTSPNKKKSKISKNKKDDDSDDDSDDGMCMKYLLVNTTYDKFTY